MWTGLGPNIARNAIINAAELASYDQVKQVNIKTLNLNYTAVDMFFVIISYLNFSAGYNKFFYIFLLFQILLNIPGFTDNIYTHLLAGLGAGFFAVCIGSPVDVVSFLDTLYV